MASDAELESLARSSNLSVGKAALIRDVQALNNSLSLDDLSALSVEELEQLRQTRRCRGLPIGKDAAAAAALAYAGLSADAAVWDADPELDENPAHYEIEVETSFGEFEYNVDAYSGQVLSGPANVSSAAPPPPTAAPPASRKPRPNPLPSPTPAYRNPPRLVCRSSGTGTTAAFSIR